MKFVFSILLTISISISFTMALAVPGLTAAQESQQQPQQQEAAELSQSDQLQVAVQRICPVTGAELGSMGSPVKVDAGGEHVFLCCAGCQSKQIDGSHWAAIQANFAAAQGTCPIMDKPVDSSMQSTLVNGRRIFVCCPPCIEKIQEDSDAVFASVSASYAAAVRPVDPDHYHVAAQGICPVSGKELGSLGGPIKVQAGEEHIFLCCDGCNGGEINAGHWATVQDNLARAQAVCPVMEKPVDASMQSTVVNGRRIYVCCPPCIEKINADPESFVGWLDGQIAQTLTTPTPESDQETTPDSRDR
ncbi:MAG: hypothetical protein AAF456_23220 [Planctomycetota bacterium]